MSDIDHSLFHTLHAVAGQSRILDAAIVFFAHYVPVILVCVGVVLTVRAFKKNQRALGVGYVKAFFAGVFARFVVAEAIHVLYQRPRPFHAFNFQPLVEPITYSFPSGHTIFLFALATGIMFTNKKLGITLYIVSFVACIARIMAGVHYPSDILGGIVLGVATAYTLHIVWRVSKPTS